MIDCLQRLADNDMVVARFYRTVLSATGARQHAARALEFAKRAGNPEQLEEIRTFLAAVDEIESLGPPREITQGAEFEGILPLGAEFDQLGPAELAPGSETPEADRRKRDVDQSDESPPAPASSSESSGGTL